jgi:hypothetical protein
LGLFASVADRERLDEVHKFFSGMAVPYYPECRIFPEAYLHDDLVSVPGLSLSVGHPIPVADKRFVKLTQELIGYWFRSLDHFSLVGTLTVAYGEIAYCKPPVRLFSGVAHDHAISMMAFVINTDERWRERNTSHRVAANRAAMDLLFAKPFEEILANPDDESMIMYATGYEESLRFFKCSFACSPY